MPLANSLTHDRASISVKSVLLTVGYLLRPQDYQLALNRRWGGRDQKISDRKMNRRMKLFFSPIFLSPIFLSPVFLRPGFNQWGAGEARAGSSVLSLLNKAVVDSTGDSNQTAGISGAGATCTQ